MNDKQQYALDVFGEGKNSIIAEYNKKKSEGKLSQKISSETAKTAIDALKTCYKLESPENKKAIKKALNELTGKNKKTSDSSDPFKGKDKTCALKENYSSRRKTPSV